MVAVPIGFNPANKAPFFGVVTRLGVGGRAQGAARKLLLLGNLIASNITRANITGSDGVELTFPDVVAGTATLATPVAVSSPEDADLLFGVGSELALMCRAVFAQRRDADVTACPVAVGVAGSPAKATATLLFENAAGSAGTIKLVISGQPLPEIAVASGATAANIAADVAIAINRMSSLPVVATVSSATVTVTAKVSGPRGNSLGLEAAFTTTTTTCSLNGVTASAIGVRGRLGAGSGTPGASADSFSAALAGCAAGEWVFVGACEDATNIGLLRAHLATYAAINERKRQQAEVALKTQSVPAAVAFNTGGSAINATRIQIGYQRDSGAGSAVDAWTPSTGELAADAAAARLYGDGAVGNGGVVKGEIAYPACNLDGVQLGGVRSPRLTSCHLNGLEIEQLLAAGITPFVPSRSNPGYQQIVKSITSYWTDGTGGATTAVHDTSCVTVADHVAELIENDVAAEFSGMNLMPEPAEPIAPPTEDVIYPSMVRATVVRRLRQCERDGLLVDVEKNLDAVTVTAHPDYPSTLLAAIPVQVIRHLHAFAGELQQLAY